MNDRQFTSVRIHQEIAFVGLNRPPGNELNEEFITELIGFFENLAAQTKPGVRAVILHSRLGEIFSNGMDGQVLLNQSVPGREKLFRLLLKLTHTLYTYPDPVIALIGGHAMAGGAILAAAADSRLFARGRFRFSFSEARVGLTIPIPLVQMIREFILPSEATSALLMAKAYRPDEVLQAGIATSLHPEESLMDAGRSFAQKIIRHPRESLRSIKRSMRYETAKAMAAYLENPGDELGTFLGSRDFEEGLLASIEKRRPNF